MLPGWFAFRVKDSRCKEIIWHARHHTSYLVECIHMTTQTVKLNKEKVDFLPKELQKAWEGADVFVTANEQSIVFSRMRQPEPEFWKTWEKLKQAGSDITEQDIDDAVRDVRAGKA